jgi:hypothetical protein
MNTETQDPIAGDVVNFPGNPKAIDQSCRSWSRP